MRPEVQGGMTMKPEVHLPLISPCLCNSTPCLPVVWKQLLRKFSPCSSAHTLWNKTQYQHVTSCDGIPTTPRAVR